MRLYLYLLIFAGFFCFSQQNTTVLLNNFSIELPGKWKRTKDFRGSQFGFENKDLGGMLSFSIREAKKIDFFKPEFNNLTDFQILEKYYRWEFDYWNEDPKNKVSEVLKNENDKLFIWKILPQSKESSFNYKLDGIQKGFIISLIYVNEKLDETKKVDLLKEIYYKIHYLK